VSILARKVPRAARIPEWKIREVEELVDLIKKHKVIGLAYLEGLPTAQLQQIRKRLRGKVVFRVTKNTLMKLALRKAGIENEDLFKLLHGQNLILFTNLNPFELALLLEEQKTYTYYKPGDIADQEIIIPAGNTGLSPGPILSTFSKLKIPIRMQGNTIWVAKDTKVAKPGDKISEELASILQKLGIALKEVRIRVKAVYEDGLVIPGDQLKLDLNEYRGNIIRAYLNALALGSEIAWDVPEALELAIRKAFLRALTLSAEAGFVTPENAEYVLTRAIAKALALAAAVAEHAPELGLEIKAVAPTKPAEEEKVEEEAGGEEEEEKEELSEEDLSAGLGALFG